MKRFFVPFCTVVTSVLLLAGCSSSETSSSTKSDAAKSDAAKSDAAKSTTAESDSVPQSDEDGEEATTKEVEATDSDVSVPDTVSQAVTSLTESPGLATDGFVGALKDVAVESCEREGSTWKANGTVTNSSETDAAYRIYVAFNVKGSTDTKAVIQADADVAMGETEKWSVSVELPEDGLECILRVERSKK